jgi:short-subunit dehydrogenase
MTKPVAVVTGAGSGIGRALAQRLDSQDYALVLCDITAEGLEGTAHPLKRRPTLHTLDVSKRADVEAMAQETLAAHGHVDLVINNAGVAVDSPLADVSYEDFEWLFGINFWGVVYGTKAFLPSMLARKAGTIVNVSSIFGIIAWPGQGTYNAAKFAVRGFTEALWHELEGTGVNAVSVHPGGIKTNIAKNARVRHPKNPKRTPASVEREFHSMARTTPEQAAEAILRGVENHQRRIMVGADAQVLHLLQRLAPDSYPALMRSLGLVR